MERTASRDAVGKPGASDWRRRVRKLALALAGVVAGLALLEAGLWALGLIVAEDRLSGSVDPASGERVVTLLCVGDSWTEGAPTGRYPDALVAMLNARWGDVRFRAINVGRAGTNSSQALRKLPSQIREHRPDLLLVLTGNNDHHNLSGSTYWKFENRSLDRGSMLAARLRASAHSLRVYRLARTTWQLASGGPTANEFFIQEGDGGAPDRSGLIAIDPETHRRQLEYNLTRFVDLARREGLPIVFQTYFHFHGYRVNEIVRDVASRYGVPLVDHNYLFHTRIGPSERESLRIPDGHPNPEGYRLMAEQIVEVLDAAGLLP